jgi:hypothetical protein
MRLSIVAFGHVHAEDLAALTTKFSHLEQLVLDIPRDSPIDSHRAEFNRAVDAATADWVLIIREREVVGEELATEIVEAVSAAKAWGFRIRSIPYYTGQPLRIGTADGELRLLQRRHLLRRGDLAVQGTVVRMRNELRSVTFTTEEEHRAHLLKQSVPRSALGRVFAFLRFALGTRTRDRNTLRYLWIEAGFGDRPES